jgi:type II secretion system protein J
MRKTFLNIYIIIYQIKDKLRRLLFNESGLSLFEMLVAVTISSLILIMVYSSHRSVTKAIYQLTGIADFYENVNLATQRIDKDISCAYFTRNNKNVSFIGEGNYEFPFNAKLSLTTIDHSGFSMLSDVKTPFPKSDVKEVGYSLLEDEKIPGLYFLVRREENHYDDEPESGGDDNIILENVVDINFEYLRGNDWTNKWDSRETKRYPNLVRTTLKLKNYNNEEEEFIIISKTNMNR